MLGRVVALAALGGFLFGYDLGLIGGAILGISNAFHISDATKEAIVGAAKLGAFFGTFIGGVCMLRYGRRKAISLQAAFFVAGPALMAAAPGPAALVAGRLLVGLGIGASAIVVPAYLAEIAPAKNRGMVVQMYEVMLTLGMLSAVLVNLALTSLAGPGAWRWMVGLPAIPGVFLLVSLVSLPESPRWLVMRGQLDAALATLHTIIASSSSSSSTGSRARSKARKRLEAVQVAAGLQPTHPAAAAGDAAWLNATPAAGRPRNPEQQALEAAEDELLLLWSSVQKEQAAGLELRLAAPTSNIRRSTAGSSNGSSDPAAAAAGGGGGGVVDAKVLVFTASPSALAVGLGGNSPRRRFAVQVAPSAAFSLDGEDVHGHENGSGSNHEHTHEQTLVHAHGSKGLDGNQQQQQQQGDVSSSSDTAGHAAAHSSNVGSSGGGSGSRLKALQQRLHLGSGHTGNGADVEGQQQLLGPGVVDSSSSQATHQAGGGSNHQQQQQQVQGHVGLLIQQQNQQQQQQQRHVEPGQESNVLVSLWAMLCDVKAFACGPEKAAFAIACCLAVFDQATASTAIINYAPEVLNSRMGIQDPQLAIMYPAAIALAKVVGTLIAAVTVDEYGRKPLLVWGGVGCGVFLGLTGVSLAASSVALFLAALCLFIFCFSLSWAGLYWVVVSEIFSMGAKSPATSAATSLLFLTGAVVNFLYLSLISWMGGAAFAVFGIVALGSAWYVRARVPETKGRTLAEIQALLAPVGTAGAQGGRPGSDSQGLLQPTAGFASSGGGAAAAAAAAGVDGGGGGGGGGFFGTSSGSPMLPLSQQKLLPRGAPAHAGESRLVELRQVMSKNISTLQ